MTHPTDEKKALRCTLTPCWIDKQRKVVQNSDATGSPKFVRAVAIPEDVAERLIALLQRFYDDTWTGEEDYPEARALLAALTGEAGVSAANTEERK